MGVWNSINVEKSTGYMESTEIHAILQRSLAHPFTTMFNLKKCLSKKCLAQRLHNTTLCKGGGGQLSGIFGILVFGRVCWHLLIFVNICLYLLVFACVCVLQFVNVFLYLLVFLLVFVCICSYPLIFHWFGWWGAPPSPPTSRKLCKSLCFQWFGRWGGEIP